MQSYVRHPAFARAGFCGAVVSPLAQMGYADRVPNMLVMSKHHWVPRVVPILGSTDYHLAVQVLARSSISVAAVTARRIDRLQLLEIELGNRLQPVCNPRSFVAS